MNIIELTIISIGLSMDAFAIAICKGMAIKLNRIKSSIIIALFFGAFQAIMPILGYFIGKAIGSFMKYNKIIAFTILLFVGVKMLVESIRNNESCDLSIIGLDIKELFTLSIATSIDAFTVGISLALLKISIAFSAFIIGIITFFICLSGALIGNALNKLFKGRAEILGGIILILIAIKTIM